MSETEWVNAWNDHERRLLILEARAVRRLFHRLLASADQRKNDIASALRAAVRS